MRTHAAHALQRCSSVLCVKDRCCTKGAVVSKTHTKRALMVRAAAVKATCIDAELLATQLLPMRVSTAALSSHLAGAAPSLCERSSGQWCRTRLHSCYGTR